MLQCNHTQTIPNFIHLNMLNFEIIGFSELQKVVHIMSFNPGFKSLYVISSDLMNFINLSMNLSVHDL